MGFGRLRVLPLVQQFMAQHPGVRIDLRLHDGFIDLVEHGIDLAVRIGELADSSLVARKLSRDLEFTLAVFLAFMTIWPLQGLFEYQGTAAQLFVMQALKTYHGAPQYGVVSLSERPGALPPGRQVLPV